MRLQLNSSLFRLVAACSLSLVAVQAFAFRGRPVSGLRFESPSGFGSSWTASLVTDGNDFLLVNSPWMQKVVNGVPAGPVHHANAGHELAWAGAHYLAIDSAGFTVTRRISRDGSVLGDSAIVFAETGKASIAATAASALAMLDTPTALKVRPLDLDGVPSGSETSLPLSFTENATLVAVGDRFAAVVTGGDVRLHLFHATGTLDRTVTIPAPTPDHRTTAGFVASDGSDLLVLFATGNPSIGDLSQLMAVVVGFDGTIQSTRAIHAVAGSGMSGTRPAGIVWAGSRYLVLTEDVIVPDENLQTPVLLAVTRGGELAGTPVQVRGGERDSAYDLAWNGRELVVLTRSGVFAVDPTLRASAPAPYGRTLAFQLELTLGAGPGGYLAAWYEIGFEGITIRASRIDAAGNYLDGDGLVLATLPRDTNISDIAVDGDGPHWLVAWARHEGVGARTISFGGTPGSWTSQLEGANGVDLLWRGTHYLLARTTPSLRIDTLRHDGVLHETRELHSAAVIDTPNSTTRTYAFGARMIVIGNEVVLVHGLRTDFCSKSPVSTCATTEDLRSIAFDTPNAQPMILEPQVRNLLGAASDGQRGLVLWSGHDALYATLLGTGGKAGSRVQVDTFRAQGAIAHDGTSFVAIWKPLHNSNTQLTTGRISADGKVTDRAQTSLAYWLDAGTLAANATVPPLALAAVQSRQYPMHRGALLFTSEFGIPAAAPPAPQIVCANEHADDTITVRWQQAANTHGISIELQMPDGTFREIAVAPAGATTARVSRSGLPGDAVRIRAWNEGGVSDPSSIAQSLPAPQASLRSALRTCVGKPVTIGFTLSGVAPFTVRWSDGVVQTNLTANASRTVTVARDTTLSIVSVADASCAAGEAVQSVRILVDPAAVIEAQPRELEIARGQTATLTIDANDDLDFAWFEGNPGDTSRPVGRNAPSFTTPALDATTRYWVRVSNRCGSSDSAPIAVIVSGGKGRVVRR